MRSKTHALARPRSLALGILLLAGAFALSAAPAQSAPTKPYAVTFSAASVPSGVSIPAGMPAGMTLANFTLTLHNETTRQQLGSANVTVPSDFTVASTPSTDRGFVEPSTDGTLRLRNLDVPPGQTATVTFDLRLPCVSGSRAWGMAAKQSNDFSGTGNDLTPPDASTLVNVVTGACALRFVAGGQPAGAGKNQPIRADAYQPTSPNLVSVEAVDGRPAALAQRVSWFTGPVALMRGPSTYPGALVPSPSSVSADGGVARFPSISITAAGTYTLRASTSAAGFATADSRAWSQAFKIVDVVNQCAILCTASLGSLTQPATTITGGPGTDSGVILLSSNIGREPVCAGYTPPVTDTWYEFELTAAREKIVVINYTKAQMRTVKSVSSLEVCFAAPGPPFPAKSGPEPFDYDGDGTDDGFVGLLVDCPSVRTSVCVTRRGTLKGGGAFIEFFAPSSLGDPRFH